MRVGFVVKEERHKLRLLLVVANRENVMWIFDDESSQLLGVEMRSFIWPRKIKKNKKINEFNKRGSKKECKFKSRNPLSKYKARSKKQ